MMKSTAMRAGVVMAVLGMAAGQSFGILYSDGGTHSLSSELSDFVWVDYNKPGKNTTFILETGGAVVGGWNVDGYKDSRITLNGGSIGWDLIAHDNSQVTLNSGSINRDLVAGGNSTVTIFGGTIGGKINIQDQAVLTIYGSDFVLDGVSVGIGSLTSIPNAPTTLAGKFLNGDAMSYQLLADAGSSVSVYLIPEPATLGLLTLGGLVLFLKKQ